MAISAKAREASFAPLPDEVRAAGRPGSNKSTFGAPSRALFALIAAISLQVAMVSPADADGINWTALPPVESNEWNSVAYGNGVWIAVAESGTNRVMRSTDDGLTWDPVAAPGANSWLSVAYGNGVWVAASSGSPGSLTADSMMRSTDDGVSWTAVTAAEANVWWSVAYGDGVWVAVAITGTNRVMRSTDRGLTWSNTGITGVAVNPWRSVAYGNEVWVAVASADFEPNRVMRSTDRGLTWSDTGITGVAANPWQSVAYGDGVWVAVASGGTNLVMRSSDDGVTWESVAAAEDNIWRSVAYGNGVWVAVSGEPSGSDTHVVGSHIMRSTDAGASWEPVPAPERNSWRSVAFADGTWIAVAASGTNRVMRSVTPRPAVVPRPVPPSVSCGPGVVTVGAMVVCTVTGGDPGIEVLWRAAYNPVIAEAGVTLDASGSGEFSFVVPVAALGEELTVELVEWLAPVSLGVAGGPVPGSVPAGDGTVPVWPILLTAVLGVGLLRRGMRAQA